MNLRRFLRPLGVAVALAVAALAIRALVGAWRQAASTPVQWAFSPGWLAAALAVALLTYLVLVESWRRTLHG
ncbi:MAG TPA: hypothetical protein VFU45_09420, partial [Gemmatimonadales bacterium]|nr:hypothetical protein [Gemmatimonadales bacterium]